MKNTYIIHGKERRELKKKLSMLKDHVKHFWENEKWERMFGGGMTDAEAENYLIKVKRNIQKIEIDLDMTV